MVLLMIALLSLKWFTYYSIFEHNDELFRPKPLLLFLSAGTKAKRTHSKGRGGFLGHGWIYFVLSVSRYCLHACVEGSSMGRDDL